ncbi:uncharacterized protein TrAtP1_009002 [Trichoderma atroviride]|uniref:uncharacterized protein n=1 Tax=Hypocrea atroviridis TaxID=63577 RepID=UPI00332B8459|nr:hypothetical protein TrAtP1_009002 [Trichoderma atroviride]
MDRLDLPQPESASSPLQCCCGSPDCVHLKKNCSILEAVEKDVHTAAQLGKALLARHEAYMADAERDRLRLNSRIERLQTDKQELEANNAAKSEENNQLLEQLELLNSTFLDSDAKIKSLEASLLSSQQAIRRLENAAARAAEADQHLKILEVEQDKLTGELRASKEEARSHAQRFKEAQRGILDMQDQLERMEREAILERQRHEEMMEKVDRQREVEKHLDAAAVRLKGAAASKSITDNRQGSKIVGHFVRDLLQDNANLQLGIAELREMLLTSNDEIQELREQLMFHQPLADDSSPASTLKAELEPSLFEHSKPPARVSYSPPLPRCCQARCPEAQEKAPGPIAWHLHAPGHNLKSIFFAGPMGSAPLDLISHCSDSFHYRRRYNTHHCQVLSLARILHTLRNVLLAPHFARHFRPQRHRNRFSHVAHNKLRPHVSYLACVAQKATIGGLILQLPITLNHRHRARNDRGPGANSLPL